MGILGIGSNLGIRTLAAGKTGRSGGSLARDADHRLQTQFSSGAPRTIAGHGGPVATAPIGSPATTLPRAAERFFPRTYREKRRFFPTPSQADFRSGGATWLCGRPATPCAASILIVVRSSVAASAPVVAPSIPSVCVSRAAAAISRRRRR